jgi:hypothetical protein
MAIKFHKSQIKGVTPLLLLQDNIYYGKKIVEVTREHVKYYRELRINEAIAKIIRQCNGTLGAAGSQKNGCLYRENGLPEFWKKNNSENVICDHAVPVTELVRMHVNEGIPIEELIFYPVVRIKKSTNDTLTKIGYAKGGTKIGFPLFRYSHLENIQLLTHHGDPVDPKTWTTQDHWRLVKSTPELKDILATFKLNDITRN